MVKFYDKKYFIIRMIDIRVEKKVPISRFNFRLVFNVFKYNMNAEAGVNLVKYNSQS